jgi:hypothetical protein
MNLHTSTRKLGLIVLLVVVLACGIALGPALVAAPPRESGANLSLTTEAIIPTPQVESTEEPLNPTPQEICVI